MQKIKLKIFFSILISFLIFTACDDTLTVQDVDNRVIPDSNVSYTQHLRPVFELYCVTCHNSSKKDGNVDLSTWSGVTDPNITFRGDAEASRLVWTIEARPGFSIMPPLPRDGLTPNQIRGIRTWIDEGAENN